MGADKSNSTGNGIVAYETLIQQIRGVVAARVILDSVGNFTEIHVVSNLERNPKQIVRDIETVMMVKFGIPLDHKIISVVQIAEGICSRNQENWRPRLTTVQTVVSRQKIDVSVSLSIQEKSYEGRASGTNTNSNRVRLVAAATLNALEHYLDKSVILAVEDVAKMSFAGSEVIVVSVTLVTAGSEQTLLGAVFAAGDEGQSIGKATLAAVNRKLAFLCHDDSV